MTKIEQKKHDEFVAAVRHLGQALIALLEERDQLKVEVEAIDRLLGNRRAFDDKPDRLAKIAHAIATAAKAEP